jgi:NADPH:quinone reductase-like Zn-dependent oxidoreductase
MKAVVYKKYGSTDVLYVQEVEKPTPKDNEILIKVHAAEVTKADCEMRSFNFAVKWFWLPLRLALGILRPRKPILGGYLSGEVEAVGKEVSKFHPGDKIFGSTGFKFGAHGEYVCLPAKSSIASKPNNLTFEEAAAVPLGGLNALHFLNKANIKDGEKVLVIGAGGSIGTFGVQIAKAMGADVTAVDSTIKENMLRNLEVDHFLDYTKSDFRIDANSYDVILNMVAKSSYSKNIGALKTQGRYLMANPRISDMLRAVITSKFTDKKSIFAFAGEKVEELNILKEMIEANRIKPVIDKVYSYEQAAEAHLQVETEQRLGAIIICPHRSRNT